MGPLYRRACFNRCLFVNSLFSPSFKSIPAIRPHLCIRYSIVNPHQPAVQNAVIFAVESELIYSLHVGYKMCWYHAGMLKRSVAKGRIYR
jgi:hypothetical protein